MSEGTAPDPFLWLLLPLNAAGAAWVQLLAGLFGGGTRRGG